MSARNGDSSSVSMARASATATPRDPGATTCAPNMCSGVVGSPGDFMWGGAASTAFWVDPVERLAVVFMTQLLPSGTFNFRGQLKTLVYGALI